jgi:hypothetical protein
MVMMEAICTSEMLVYSHETIQHYISEGSDLQHTYFIPSSSDIFSDHIISGDLCLGYVLHKHTKQVTKVLY